MRRDGLFTTNCASHGLELCAAALTEPGDEVVLTDPTYAGLINRVHLAGGVPKFARLPPGADGWRLDPDSLAAAIGPRTKALLVMSPSMPSGTRGAQSG